MCKLLIVLSFGGIFLSGCASSEASLTQEMVMAKPEITTRTSKYAGCKMLSSGYLVCPKVPIK